MKIISFFSFKGGVGRTALLTNLGAYWSSKGKIVLLMDLDLAAPGLSYSLDGKMLDEKGRGLGIGDLLHTFFENIKADPRKIQLLPPGHLIREVVFHDPKFRDAAGNLFFIPAGQRHFVMEKWEPGALTGEAVVPTIAGTEPGKDEKAEQTASRALAYYLKEHLQDWTVPGGPSKGRKIDYLLIDTRTGFAELLDLSLGYLADQMVLLFSLNEQNLNGLKLTLEALKTKRVPIDTFPLLVTVIFSPLPASEDIQLFQRMEKAHQVIARALRFSRAGQRELAPKSFSLHYNQILATRESLLVLEHPKSLYSREVKTIAHHLEGKTADDDLQDDLIRETRRKAMKVSQVPGPEPAVEKPEFKMPIKENPFTNLPPWYWPLPAADQDETRRNQILNELMPENPHIEINREIMANQLCWSISLSIEEKQRIMETMPKLSQTQVDELGEIFEEERLKFMSMWKDIASAKKELIKIFIEHQRQWAIFILKDEKAGNQRFFTAPDEHIFPLWEKQTDYWFMMVQGVLTHLEEADLAIKMVDCAMQMANNPGTAAVGIMEGLSPKNISASHLRLIEGHLVSKAPSEPWLKYFMARNHLQEVPSDKNAAIELLKPLLQSPPDNARLCFKLAALVMDDLPGMAFEAEAAIRKAVELDPGYARAWKTLGNLLRKHLNRYQEAESSYRKAIELDEKFADPWNELGNLLQDHLNRYEEAEIAYRKAIELDETLAYPWYNLGNLLKDHLNRYEEAEAAYRKAIELDETSAYPWDGLGDLLKDHLNRYEEAETAYRKAIELDEKFPHPLNGLGLLQRNFLLDCEGAVDAFQQGLKITENKINAYLNMNLGGTCLLMGKKKMASDYLARALEDFDQQSEYDGNALIIAVKLDDAEKIQKYLPLSEKKCSENDFASTLSLLLYTVTKQEEDVEDTKKKVLDLMKSYDDHFDMLRELYYLSGFRPGVKPQASRLAAELLTLPEELTKRFKDQPRPGSWYDRFRPFAEGKSRGAGDPKDRHLFCRKINKKPVKHTKVSTKKGT